MQITADMLHANILDVDHSVTNFVVPKDGQPVRIDFEFARHVTFAPLRSGIYATMIGRLIGSYAFAVQPEIDRATRFAERLVKLIRPARRVCRQTQAVVDQMFERQREERGIDVKLSLSW